MAFCTTCSCQPVLFSISVRFDDSQRLTELNLITKKFETIARIVLLVSWLVLILLYIFIVSLVAESLRKMMQIPCLPVEAATTLEARRIAAQIRSRYQLVYHSVPLLIRCLFTFHHTHRDHRRCTSVRPLSSTSIQPAVSRHARSVWQCCF